MKVVSVKYDSDSKTYRLKNGRILGTHRYCCLGPGDDVVIQAPDTAHTRCVNGPARILPSYSARDRIHVGTRTLTLTVKEPVSALELDAYHKLEDYHYRGKVLHGRRAPLIVTSRDPLLPHVLGYIELSTAFIMNKPRALLFDSPFKDRRGNISWTEWRKDATRRYTNLVVRIARCVVSPEFRGLGLARILVEHAISFARHHWHVGGMKPLFLEITADMLRYVPFVESAGMHYIGDTEGNLGRVEKDMDYLLQNYERVKGKEILREDAAGIVDLQVQYVTCLKQIESEQGMSRQELLRLLMRSPQRLSDDNWALLHRVFRLPKPTFLMGLTAHADRFVCKRLKELEIPTRYPVQHPISRPPRLNAPIEVRDCSLHLDASLTRTRFTRKVQQAFGVKRDMLTTTLFTSLTFDIQPGDIVLLCGPSGAGKTTLLSVLVSRLSAPTEKPVGFDGDIRVPPDARAITLTQLSSARPLVNSLGVGAFEDALFALNVSGLAEAHLYVKRFRELSNGQRYRAMVAKLIASDADVWVADEFCATLDPITANIVARNLRRCAKQLGVTTILAAANWGEFIHELRPDKIVHLRSPWDHRVFSWDDFQRALGQSHMSGPDIGNRPCGS